MARLHPTHGPQRVRLRTVAAEWTRLGITGFGGPPAHIAMLRDLCVRRRRWMSEVEFDDAITACNLLPGPASTQLAILCARRVSGPIGGIIGGLAFIVPGLIAIVALAAVFLASSPPQWVVAAGAGAGAAVPAVALGSALTLGGPSWHRSPSRLRWLAYAATGAVAAMATGPWIVLLLLCCGLVELARRTPWRPRIGIVGIVPAVGGLVWRAAESIDRAGWGALTWVAAKVGALSYGGGFVIIPLMRHDAVARYSWMTDRQFLDAVALGQITPGPVVQTVGVVGFAAEGVLGAALAAFAAFAPSFLLVLALARYLPRLAAIESARAFLDGAGAGAIGAIAGVAIPLSRTVDTWWQLGVLGAASIAVIAARRGAVPTLVVAAAVGVVAARLGAPLP